MKEMGVDTGKFSYKDSLCWHCSKSTHGGCSWSSGLRPVDGWTASHDDIRQSYIIRECPLYENSQRICEYDDIGVRKLADAVLAKAGADYMSCMVHERQLQDKVKGLKTKRMLYKGKWTRLYGYEPFNNKIIALEKFFRSEYAEQFGVITNPIYIMEVIQKRTGIRHEIV